MNVMSNLTRISFAIAMALFAVAPLAAQTPAKPKATAAKTHRITADQAKKIALAKFKGKVTKAPVLEKEDGVWQWEVIVVDGKTMTEVNVNADTGKIGSTEKVTEKEEAAEKKKKKG